MAMDRMSRVPYTLSLYFMLSSFLFNTDASVLILFNQILKIKKKGGCGGKKSDRMEMSVERGSSDVVMGKVSMKIKIKIMIAKITMIATRSACEYTLPWARLPFWASPPQNR